MAGTAETAMTGAAARGHMAGTAVTMTGVAATMVGMDITRVGMTATRQGTDGGTEDEHVQSVPETRPVNVSFDIAVVTR